MTKGMYLWVMGSSYFVRDTMRLLSGLSVKSTRHAKGISHSSPSRKQVSDSHILVTLFVSAKTSHYLLYLITQMHTKDWILPQQHASTAQLIPANVFLCTNCCCFFIHVCKRVVSRMTLDSVFRTNGQHWGVHTLVCVCVFMRSVWIHACDCSL